MLEIETTTELIDNLYRDGECYCQWEEIHQNEPFILKAGQQSAVLIRKGDVAVLVREQDVPVKSRNSEQLAAIWMLCDDSMPLVTMAGKAGTGKTLLAIAVGLKMLETKRARRLFIARPNVSLDNHNDHGHLPGTLEEKLLPLFGSVFDALQVLKYDKKKIKHMMDEGQIEFLPLAFIRGRSLHDCMLIVDEAQNLNSEEIKTIATRIGTNCKLVFSGDATQIDIRALRPQVDRANDGLSYLIGRTQNQSLVGHVKLRKSERSEICELLCELL